MVLSLQNRLSQSISRKVTKRNNNNKKKERKEKKLSSFVIRLLYNPAYLSQKSPSSHTRRTSATAPPRAKNLLLDNSVRLGVHRATFISHVSSYTLGQTSRLTHIHIYTQRVGQKKFPRAKRSNRPKGNRRS